MAGSVEATGRATGPPGPRAPELPGNADKFLAPIERGKIAPASTATLRMPRFDPTVPFGEPELPRASGFAHYLAELERTAPEGAPSTRLSSLSPSLAQDLMRFEQDGRAADLLEVLAACVRHGRNLTVHLRCLDKLLPLNLFPNERLAHCPLDLRELVGQRRVALAVLQVEPAVLRPPGDPQASMVGDIRWYRPLSPLLWTMAVHGTRDSLLPELTGAAVYRVSPAFDLTMLHSDTPLHAAVGRLRRGVASQREIANWPGMTRNRAIRLLNALYLQAGLIVSRSHPAALGDSWFGGV
jgi:hypothetical protein